MKFYLWYKKSISQNLANTAFLLLFPGFFFYHFAIARGFIPPVLGGYFGIIALLVFLPLIFTYFNFLPSNYNGVVLIFFLIVIYTLAVVVYNYFANQPNGYAYDMAFWSISGVLFNAVAFLIAAQINLQKILKINIATLILMVFIVVLNVSEYGIFYVKQDAVDGTGVATYQGFARSIVFVSLIVTAAFIKNFKILFFIFLISTTALLLNGARTEFAVYIASSLISMILYGLKSLKGILVLIASMLVLFLVVNYLTDLYPQSRMLQLFALQESSSFNSRYDLNSYGLSLIADSPLMGAYGMYVFLDGIGSYPHNLLSAWVNLGIFGFTLYVIIFYIFTKSMILAFKKNSANFSFRVFLIFFIFTITSLIISKDYSYMAFGFLVGLYLNWKNSTNN